MKQEIKNIFKEVYFVKTPRFIQVGDPSIIEELNTSEDEELFGNLIFKDKIPKIRQFAVVFAKDRITDTIQYNCYRLTMIYANREYLHMLIGGKFYKEKLKENGRRQLSSDTGQFDITVDDKTEKFYFLCDGYIGDVLECCNKYGKVVNIDLPDMTMTEEQMRKAIDNLFNCPEIL